MYKKILKYSTGLIAILILIVITTIVYANKNSTTTKNASQTVETKELLDPAQVTAQETQDVTKSSAPEQDDGSLTYNTAGNDSANYEDGDTSGTKSEWVKNGDTWQYTFYVDDPDAQWYVWEDSESLMDGYTGDYTEYNAGTLFTEETLTSFTPTDNMSVSTNSDGNNVYTWLDTENSYKVIDNGDGTYTKITTKLSFTVTNYDIDTDNSVYYGNLVINKIVKNSDGSVLNENEDSTNFVFTVKLTASDETKAFIEGTKTFSDIVFKDGVGTVSLKAGGSITISGIPAGVSYTVEERAVDGYETTYDSNSGIIVKDANSTVTFTNQKGPQTSGGSTQTYTSFTLKKEVTGNYEVEQSYNFEISMSNLKQNTTYTLSNGTNFTSDSNGTANVSVTLKNNESVIVQNIPIGSKYKVYEYAGDYVSSYVITDNNNIGSINNSSNNNTKQNTALSTQTETADEGEDITITFTNEKNVTQNLKLVKQVTDENDKNSYMFTIEFANMSQGTSFNTTFGKITADANGKAEATIYLAGGEEAEAYDVPVGTTYKITELASSAIASYTITDKNGTNKIVKQAGANTANKTALSTEQETVNEGEEATITFINDTVNQEPDNVSISLGVTKNVVNKNGEKQQNCEDVFTFEITAEDANSPMPEEVSDEENSDENASDENDSYENGPDENVSDENEKTENSQDENNSVKNKVIKIKGNGTESFGTITFTQIGTYTYKITELSEDLENYEYDKSVYTIVYEVTNTEGLLEVTKTVKKDGFNSDVIEFVNTYIEPEQPSTPTDEEEPTTPTGENGKENNNQEQNESTEEKTEQNAIQTGDKILRYFVILILSGVVLVVVWKRKK